MTPAVGRSVPRKEDARLLVGHGTYAADFRLPGLLHAAVLRSKHPHARLGVIRAKAALDLPGVVTVVTAADLGDIGRIPVRMGQTGHGPNVVACLQPPLAREKVRYVGEPIAVVIAESRYVAEDALDLIDVDYDPLPAIADARRAVERDAPVLHEVIEGNVVATLETVTGDAAAAMAGAHTRVRERLAIQRHAGVPLETRGLTASFDARTGIIQLWGVAKVPYFNRRVLADLIGYPEHLIQFVELDVGGGFGVRGEFYPEDLVVPWAAKRLGRPVQWIEDRREHLMAANHSRQQWHETEIGFDRDGRIVALIDRFMVDLGGYIRTHGVVVPELTAALMPGPYRIPNYRSEIRCVLTNKTPTGTYRGPGRYEGTFVRERLMDIAAARLGVDPLELRRRNFVTPAQMPYDVGGASLGQRTTYDCGDYGSALDHALEAIGWNAARVERDEARRRGRFVGLGVACLVEKAGLGPYEYARVEVDATGHVVVYSGIASVGQGIETTLAQVVADELGVTPEAISVVHGDSARVPFGVGGFASRGAAVALPAALEASRKVRAKLVKLAARLLEAAPDDLVVERGAVHVRGVPDKALTFRELARRSVPPPAELEPGLHAEHFFEAPKMTYPYGTHAAMVEVDGDTGRVKVLRYAISYDIGKAINPMIVEGQLVGALAQGLGGALYEELVYDDAGQPLTTSFLDYL
ncbi:MAG TPA: xanthine dehydrogenase family protein molybdopterin-binding subunit, partial [Candidatus Limnocylindria bacterium]|nr:xanthine dehydrogenase family protein molybdopterin-binding subunit [Candidatus Limnocylindria bacterium]